MGDLKDTADAATAVMVSGFGREQELEADQIGGALLAKAGYNPFAMIEMLQVLKDQETFEKSISGGRQTYHGLFASHPKNDKRLHDAVELSYRYQNQLVEPIADYWARIDGLVYARPVAPEGQAGCHPPAPAPAPQPPGAPPGERQRRRTDALLNSEELESLGLLGEHEPG